MHWKCDLKLNISMLLECFMNGTFKKHIFHCKKGSNNQMNDSRAQEKYHHKQYTTQCLETKLFFTLKDCFCRHSPSHRAGTFQQNNRTQNFWWVFSAHQFGLAFITLLCSVYELKLKQLIRDALPFFNTNTLLSFFSSISCTFYTTSLREKIAVAFAVCTSYHYTRDELED